MKNLIKFICLVVMMQSCISQTKTKETIRQVGGPCEGCEALLEYGDKSLKNTDTVLGFSDNTPQLKLTGTVYHNDGKTPAEDIIIYAYQTNRAGIYTPSKNASGWERRHGKHRTWLRTDKDGKYTIFTFRPGSYPNRLEPEHIHITVKEPNTNAYYIDDFVFDDDPLLTPQRRQQLRNRCGSGISKPQLKDGILTTERDLILGLNIPDYE
ncbi:MAG: intradiol ring-cleavage dioxygenase [Winogradskyella sp.]|nr:intradiol ring-cleavage dioxygenase [Winogradskyella sp.]